MMREELPGGRDDRSPGVTMAGRGGADVDGGLLAGTTATDTGPDGHQSQPTALDGSDAAISPTAGEEPSAVGEPAAPTEAPAGATAPLAPAPLESSPRTRRGAVLGGLAGVLIAALAAALLVTWVDLRHHQAADRARDQALTSARSYAVELASYDYHHLDRDFGAVLADSTPTFAKSFTKSSQALKSVLTKYSATAQARVVAAGVVSSSTDHAVVLVFLNQTVTNNTQKSGPTTDQSRLQINLAHTGGHWAIDAVHLL